MPNVHIGKNVVIGAGTIVTRSIADNKVVYNMIKHVVRELEDEYYEDITSK